MKNQLQFSYSLSALQQPPSKHSLANETNAQAVHDESAHNGRPPSPTTIMMAKLLTHSELKVPDHPAPRPNTLPMRHSLSSAVKSKPDHIETDSNPLRILRDKNYPIVRPRMRVNIDNNDTNGINGNGDDACESPSYLTNPEYTFSERDVNIQHNDTQKFIGNKEIENLNPIPLPPRDRNKILPTNVKRHVRKHPLIIPASGLQRTLNKVTTPVEEKFSALPTTQHQKQQQQRQREIDEVDGTTKQALNSNKINYNTPRTSTKPAEASKLHPIPIDHSYINQEDINVFSKSDEEKMYTKKFIENNFPDTSYRTYENLDSLRAQMNNIDSASLHFESILESDGANKVGETSIVDSSVNGFGFELRNTENYDVPRTSIEMRSSMRHSSAASTASVAVTAAATAADIERKKNEFSQKYPNYSQPRNELSDNALFLKFRAEADGKEMHSDTSSTKRTISNQSSIDFGQVENVNEENDKILERKLQDSNSVSCEDLLEFADKKPKGKERGIESDEVRIMTKVLGSIVSRKVFFLFFFFFLFLFLVLFRYFFLYFFSLDKN